MSKILKVRNVNDYGHYLGCADQHPLVSVIDYAEVSPIRHSLNNYSVYGLFLRDDADVDLDYGCGKYDYNKGTLLCVAPGQIGGKEDNGERVAITGWALLFHPDLLHGFPLEKRIKEYSFFDYRVNEALHMTNEEHDILVRFDRLLRDYFEDKLQLTLGLPSVQYCADKLCMSANYFGDVIKKTTGDTASNHIRRFVIQLAKNGLAAGETVTQVSDRLGFEYPQHFSRMFKKQEDVTPSEYCQRLRT